METVSFFPSLLKMLFALAIVLGMMIGAMYFIKRILHSTTPEIDRGALIRIVASRYLGPKNSIMVVDVAGQIIVIGLSNQQMTVLKTISDKEALERMRKLPVESEMPSAAFAEQFSRYKEKIMSAMDSKMK
ncbi:flagellar biosynthetic protein FliO [Syntrophus aciditrophicus]|uniref:Flagellar protein n=1 Tax=Syntrophus aciditrophicus (strain SB) TaxID=56780 RepID=Q2LT01_SYNAS|nr:flagellar biosynthetic protein FliO [Syntrophus aciditrophicus]ABC77213.1 flagellar biosynthetic protein [Syntrophus aciditrophicus SB]OPY17284.1 MAG: flagellar biosynthesis protein FliO [Syntrophus sp. PtaB.Bin075]